MKVFAPKREPVEALVEACRRGDAEAFERLFDRYKDYVYSVAVHALGDDALAADVVQDVFLKLLTRLGQFRGEASFETWLYRVTVNAAVDARRAVRTDVSVDDPRTTVTLAHHATPEDEASRNETATRVRRALATLAPKLQAPVILRYVLGLAYDEIAEALEISPGTVASRLARAHRELAARLGKRGRR